MKYLLPIVSILFLYQNPASAQGCADAGFCTADNLKPTVAQQEHPISQIKLGTSYGKAQFGVHVLSPFVEYSHQISERITFTNKLLFAYKSGVLTSTFNFSDIIATVNYRLTQKLRLIAGLKIPLNRSNLSYNGTVLPMSYQTSLGTLDYIIGATYTFDKLSLTFAHQQPLIQNKNTFVNEPAGQYEHPYYTTNQYKRAGDLLLRVSYQFTLANKKTNIMPSIMPIYHIKNDTYYDSVSQEDIVIEQSKGITLNIGTFLEHKVSKSSSIGFNLGFPVLARKSRPDGLSQFAVGLDYTLHLFPKADKRIKE